MPRKGLPPALLPGLLPEVPPVRILAERETDHKIALPIKGKKGKHIMESSRKIDTLPHLSLRSPRLRIRKGIPTAAV